MNALIVATTQRQIGYVIAAIVLIAMVTYWIFNWIEGRKEAGAEIELAANRKTPPGDEEMETKRLDLALTGGLGLLTVIALALPLYWLGEPGRHEGLVDFTDEQFVEEGGELYAENCAQCHGSADGPGGLVPFALVDNSGVFVEQVDWNAPSLGAVLDRFSYDELKYILNFGRSNSPMPAWGAPGGGPMTDQQIDKVIAYLAHEQKDSAEIAAEVEAGVRQLAEADVRAAQADLPPNEQLGLIRDDIQAEIAGLTVRRDGYDPEEALFGRLQTRIDELQPALNEAQAALDAAIDAQISEGTNEGNYLFNNPAGAGAYGCARCHSAGWSYDANAYPQNPLIEPVVDGSGGFGPSLQGVRDQFETADSMVGFIVSGTKDGLAYGRFGQGDGGGQMPGFGACWAEDNPLDFPRIQGDRISGHCDGRTGILSQSQIEAIVAYERSLGDSQGAEQ